MKAAKTAGARALTSNVRDSRRLTLDQHVFSI
jgi:hypothetical protein